MGQFQQKTSFYRKSSQTIIKQKLGMLLKYYRNIKEGGNKVCLQATRIIGYFGPALHEK